MEEISWTDHVRNEDVLLRVKEERNILHKIRKRKANWIGHFSNLIHFLFFFLHLQFLTNLKNKKCIKLEKKLSIYK